MIPILGNSKYFYQFVDEQKTQNFAVLSKINDRHYILSNLFLHRPEDQSIVILINTKETPLYILTPYKSLRGQSILSPVFTAEAAFRLFRKLECSVNAIKDLTICVKSTKQYNLNASPNAKTFSSRVRYVKRVALNRLNNHIINPIRRRLNEQSISTLISRIPTRVQTVKTQTSNPQEAPRVQTQQSRRRTSRSVKQPAEIKGKLSRRRIIVGSQKISVSDDVREIKEQQVASQSTARRVRRKERTNKLNSIHEELPNQIDAE